MSLERVAVIKMQIGLIAAAIEQLKLDLAALEKEAVTGVPAAPPPEPAPAPPVSVPRIGCVRCRDGLCLEHNYYGEHVTLEQIAAAHDAVIVDTVDQLEEAIAAGQKAILRPNPPAQEIAP